MDYLNDAIIVALSTAAGVLISKVIDLFRAKKTEDREDKKADADIDKSETSLALEMYKGLIVGLKDDLREMMAHIHRLEQERLSCREENAKLREKVEHLTQRLNFLEEELKKASDE